MDDAEKLIERLDDLKQYYFKGAKGIMSMINSMAKIAVTGDDEVSRSRSLDLLRVCRDKFVEHYPSFEAPEGPKDTETLLLIIVNSLAKQYISAVQDFINTPSVEKEPSLVELSNEVVATSDIFRESLRNLEEEIRSYSGHEDYRATTIDHKGDRWSAFL